MNKITALLTSGTTVLAVIATMGAASAPASQHRASSASRAPVAYGVPYGSLSAGSNFVHAKVRPTGKLYWTGDGSAWFAHMRWSSWSGSGARGSATEHYLSSNRRHVHTAHARLHFWRIRTHRGHRYFTRLHFTVTRKSAGPSATLVFYRHGSPAWYYAHRR